MNIKELNKKIKDIRTKRNLLFPVRDKLNKQISKYHNQIAKLIDKKDEILISKKM